MLRSWDFLDHGDERITPILRHSEQGPVNSEQLTVNSSLRVDKQSQMCDSTDKNCSRFTGYCSLKRKAAFTLAEVLITLGIIGVVAALTLPTLIANYQKQVYVNQLKKSVSVLSQGFTTMMGKDGVTELKDTDAFNIPSYVCDDSQMYGSGCNTIKEAFQNTFTGITFDSGHCHKYKTLDGSRERESCGVIRFSDGSYIFDIFFIREPQGYKDGTMKGSMGYFNLDINGDKNPNTMGRDVFKIELGNNGSVYGYASMPASEVYFNGDANSGYWRTSTNNNYKCTASSLGYGCAARVLEEDAMNY